MGKRVHGRRLGLARHHHCGSAVGGKVAGERFQPARRNTWRSNRHEPNTEQSRQSAHRVLDLARAERDAVVGRGTRKRLSALNRVQPAHFSVGARDLAVGHEVPRVAHTGADSREDVRVETRDNTRPVEVVHDGEVFAERDPPALERGIVVDGFVLVPARGGKLGQQLLNLPGERRRGHVLGQQRQPGTTAGHLRVERGAHCLEERRVRRGLPVLGHHPSPIGVVEVQDFGLHEDVRRAEARGVARVALDLRGASLVRLDEHADADTAELHRGRVRQRFARNDLLGHRHVGHDRLFGKAAATRQAGERHRSAHQLEEVAPVEAQQRRTPRKLVFEERLEVGGVRNLFKAAPIALAGFALQAFPNRGQIEAWGVLAIHPVRS